MAQTVKITPASGLLEFIGNTTSNKPYLQHDDNGNLTLTLQATKKFTVAGNLKVNGKVTMAQQTLTDGAAITWDFNSGANARVTIAGARTLVITNMEVGDTGLILVKQDTAGSRTLALPAGSSLVGGGSYTASTAANATDVLGVYYDGTTYWWTIGYNTVATPLTSVGITGSDFTISNSPLTSNGNIGLALATVNSNVGVFGSATAVPVITVNAKGLVTAVSTTNISIPTNLDSLTDVTISSAATNQLLQFNGSQWVNWTPNYLTGITSSQVTTALGYTPVPTTRTLSINGTSYDLSANRAWTIDTVNYVSRVQHEVKAGVAINKGQAVYATGADGTNIIVGLASNTSEATSSKTMGLLDATVATNGFANVVTEGLLTNIDTSQAGTAGDPVWLGQNGNLIYGLPNKPYAPNHLVFIGIVTRKNASTGEIFVKVQNGFELDELHTVDIKTIVPVNGHILGYDGTLWVNKTIAGWLGFTPANDANVVHTTGNESIAGVKTFSDTTQSTSITSGGLVTNGGVGIAKNLYVGGNINVVGNLTIGGTTTTINASNLSVSDNLILLNNGGNYDITNIVANGTIIVYTTGIPHNYSTGMSVTIIGCNPIAFNLSNKTITAITSNTFTIASTVTGSFVSGGTARAQSNANPDLGWAGGYNDGSYAHTGLFRDATDNTYKFFKGYTLEPDASPFIDTAHASFAYADVRGYNITGNSFIKSGGTSSQFLKADGSVDSNTYLTTGTASSTYQPLDADLTAIAGLATTGFLKRTGSNTWSLDSNTYLTSYTETDTLATVTARGATTSVATSFTGGASISNLLINGAAAYTEGSLALGAMGTGEGGQLVLNKATAYTYAAHIDVWQDGLRFLYGTNAATSGVAMSLNLSTRQLILPSYTATSSFTGTAAGVLAFDASGNILTIAVPGGAVSSVNAGTGVSVNQNTGAVTVSIGQSVATTATPTFDYVITTNNGNGTNVKIGDDVWIGDVNKTNTLGLKGQQDATSGYITFGSDLNTALGRVSTGDLTWGGNRIWHAGNLTNLNQLTNGPGYITGYTETDTLQTVTTRGATTSIASSFTGGASFSGGANITGLTITKSGTDSTITFPAQTNDPGYIKHYESANTAIMYFNVSDDSNDYFYFGYSTSPGTFQLRSDGVVTTGTWQASAIADSYISSAATWNAKQAALSGSGIVKSASGTISYISGTSAQFIKGDGSLDSSTYLTTGTAASTYLTISTAASTYLTTTSASSTYLPLAGGTITGKVTFPSSFDRRPQFPGGILGLNAGDGDFDIWGISTEYYPSHATAANAWGLRWNGANNDFEFVGGGTNRVILDMDGGNITSTGSITGTSFVKSGGTSSQFLKADGSVDSSTYATQGYVTTAVSNLVASAPAALDTLNELAAALGNDASFSTTVSTALGNRLRVDINSQGLTSTQKGYGRTNLGVVIGTDVQAWDGDLDAIAALAGTSGFLKKTAANTWSLDTSTYITGNQTITLSGDITGSGTTSISTALSNTGVTASTYKSVTVDAKGRVTAGSNPTTLAGYGITNAIANGDYLTQNTFSGKTISLNPVVLKELLFGGSNRYTQTDSYTGAYPSAGSTWIRTYQLNNGENATYSTGNVYVGFWVNYPPANVTVRVRNTSGTWYGPFTGSDVSITGQFAFWKIPCGGANFIDTWEITFTPTADRSVNLQTVNIVIDNSEGIDQFPLVHRDGSTMYGRLNFMSSGSVRGYFDPSGAIYSSGNITGNSFIKSGGTSSQFLKADGSVDSSSYITGITSGNVTTALGYTPVTNARTLTINGTGYDLTANRSWSVGTVTSVGGTGTVSGLTLTGTVTSTGNLTLGGTLSLTSANVTTALGFTPYNATNPNGYITGITSSNVTTALGYTPYNSSNPSGYLSSVSIDNITDEHRIFNNMGEGHSTRTSFDASTPSYNFGFRFIQGLTNGPAAGGGNQFYSWYLGLGDQYPATGAGSYGVHVAIPRNATTPYMSVRYNENNSLGSWIKIAAGYADTAGALSSMNISQFTNNSGYLTGITSGQVTTALGFTPYNATNPSGYTSNTGTVTSVSGTGTVSGLTLTGTVTGSGNLTLGGTLSLTSANVTTALGFTPYNATNPNGYITSYAETSTLAQVTARGATTSVNSTFTGGLWVNSTLRVGANYHIAQNGNGDLEFKYI